MFDMQFIREILLTVGLSGLVVIIVMRAGLLLVGAWANRANAHTGQVVASTQKDEIVNTFVVKFNDDIKELRDKHETLQEKFHETDKELAREQGRREQMQLSLDTERSERNKLNDEIQKQNIRIIELEKYQQQSKQRISELETEIEQLNKKLAEANTEKSLLQAQKRELEKLLELEQQRASSLSARITQYQEEAMAVASPDIPDVDDTFVPLLNTAAIGAAEESKP